MECNPDDVTAEFAAVLSQLPVNRVSMGAQTFSDERLRFLHRRHTTQQVKDAVAILRQTGIRNISIDLMFGFPKQTLDEWKSDVQTALSLQVQHLSAYSLMYEEGTVLERMLTEGCISEVDEEVSLQMYEHLMDALNGAGYEHYELSNFALPSMRSRHNSGYWQGVPYLGVGAGAHSYDGSNRFYHTDSLEQYMDNSCALVTEHLNDHERYDEYVFTSLRTSEGLDLSKLERHFGVLAKKYCLQNAQKHLKAGLLSLTGDTLCLTRRGLFISNEVMSDLMWDD
jgi:oxygen-independent coproporphyrinogen-3 oxidase